MPDAPRLVEVLASAVEASLRAARDNWIRVELPTDWPVGEAVNRIATSVNSLRIGVLRPFAIGQLDLPGDLTVSDDPQLITRWRNAAFSVRRGHNTVKSFEVV